MANEGGISEMEFAMNIMPDILLAIANLQEQMFIMQPVMFSKHVLDTVYHIFPDADREQQQYINREAARIMTEYEEQKKEEVDDDDDDVVFIDNNELNNVKPRVSQTRDDIRNALIQYSKQKGHTPSDTQKFMTFCKKKKNIKKANWSLCKDVIRESNMKSKKLLWSEFNTDYNRYNDNDSKQNLESLQDILKKIREFAVSEQHECINGLLDHKSKVIIINFLSLLEIGDNLIRECVVMILQSLYDVCDDNFIAFANNNNVIQYLSKSLILSQNAMDHNDTSARIDMKILQLLAVNFTGKELLYHTVFNEIKECIMSPYQHIDFIEYALNVILTIINEAKVETAKEWINRDCKDDVNIDHTIQFVVYIIQTYSETQSDQLSRQILNALSIDVEKALIDFGIVETNNEEPQNMNPSSPIQITEPTETIQNTPIQITQPTANTTQNMQYSQYHANERARSGSAPAYHGNMPSGSSSPYNQYQHSATHSPYNVSGQYTQQQMAEYYQKLRMQQQYRNSAQYAAYYRQQMQQQYRNSANQYQMQQQMQQQYRKSADQYQMQQQMQRAPQQQMQLGTQKQMQPGTQQQIQRGTQQQLSPYSHQQMSSFQNQNNQQKTSYIKPKINSNIKPKINPNIQPKMNPNIQPKMNPNTQPKMNSNKLNLPQLNRPNLHKMSSNVPIQDKIHPSLAQLLLRGTVMTKYLSIHTDIANHLQQIHTLKCKYKMVRMSQDWKAIEFHNISQQKTSGKPKSLPIQNILYIRSSFSDSNPLSFQNSQDLLLYALDKIGKEIVIKLVTQSQIQTKRWTIAINQIIQHFKQIN